MASSGNAHVGMMQHFVRTLVAAAPAGARSTSDTPGFRLACGVRRRRACGAGASSQARELSAGWERPIHSALRAAPP